MIFVTVCTNNVPLTARQDDSGDRNTTTEEDEEVGIEAVESEMKALESHEDDQPEEETTEGEEEIETSV